MKAVILCGGSGTRLWPLSTPNTPKQFLQLIHEHESMFQSTCLLAAQAGATELLVILNKKLINIASTQVKEIQHRLPFVKFLLEPIGRNTAPAIAGAALINLKTDEPLIVLPSDHTWELSSFTDTIHKAVDLAVVHDSIVTLGIKPTYPETGYGYIENDKEKVISFREKPDIITANEYIESGRYLWNSGVFIFKPSVMINEFKKYKPELLKTVEESLDWHEKMLHLHEETFSNVENLSIDYAIMEKTTKCLVVPHDGLWNDVGSYRSLHQVVEKDENNNHFRGVVRESDAKDSLVLNSSDIRVNILGVENLIVVVSKKGTDVLITTPAYSQYVNRFKN